MPQISFLALAVFLALVSVLALAFVLGVRQAAPRAEAPTLTGRWTWRAAALLVIWLGLSAVLARSGTLRNFAALPPPMLLLIGTLTLVTFGLSLSSFGTRLVNGISIGWLIGFQAFRLPLEWLLHRLFQEGVVPVQMTYSGRNFDIVTGGLALLLLVWAKAGQLPRWAIWLFNLAGLALLMNIVSIAVLSTPVPFRRFFNEPANTFIAEFPFIWLPAFLVQAAWFGHLLVFRWLRQPQNVQ